VSVVAIISIFGAVRGTGVFAAGASVVSLQLFLLILGVSLLTLAVVIDERVTLLTRQRKFNRLLSEMQERERTRIARELHDDFGQQMALLKLDLHQLTDALDGRAASIALEAAQRADDVAAGLRDLSHSLHPARLRLLGLVPALKGFLGELSHHGPCIAFTQDNVPESLPEEVSLTVFRVAQEALSNAIKHGRAEHVTVRLNGGLDSLVLTVVDDGAGFVVDTSGEGLGLISMGERVEAIGGTLKIESTPRLGTRLDVKVPLLPGSGADGIV
jgi:signal transduction histidine kinase